MFEIAHQLFHVLSVDPICAEKKEPRTPGMVGRAIGELVLETGKITLLPDLTLNNNEYRSGYL